ncbi:MAG: MBL fold metallo-hydrolase [Candidatus Uhrbacteria bacterium]|nr:MBL fold metallo-hydrolase [Candidatus Uhrbacteria bacterium]
MQIIWNGLSCFEIIITTSEGEVTLVTDPYDNATGLRFPRTLEANVVLVSHDEEDANNLAAIAGTPKVIDMPGEFEVRNVFMYGIDAPLKREVKGVHVANCLFRVEAEGMNIAHLGSLDRALSDNELQELANIDILMVPVGGGAVLSPKLAAEVIAQIEPRVVIPMTFELPNLKEALQPLGAFMKEMAGAKKEEMNKYKVARKDLPEEDMLIVTLSK